MGLELSPAYDVMPYEAGERRSALTGGDWGRRKGYLAGISSGDAMSAMVGRGRQRGGC